MPSATGEGGKESSDTGRESSPRTDDPPAGVGHPREASRSEPTPPGLAEDRARFLSEVAPWISKGLLRPDALSLLDRYAALLYDRVPSLALIAKGDRETIYTRHILDSLGPLAHFGEAPGCILDIGSGGGLPGIPLGIVWAESRVVLLESREKKAAFLESAVRTLGLGRRIRVVCERLEEHVKKTAPMYDALFVRAVADPSRLIELVAPSCLPGARWFYFLGAGADREALASDFAITGREIAEVPGALAGRLLTGSV